MLRVIPNGIPSGIPAPESGVGSRSGDSRNSSSTSNRLLSCGCLLGGSKSIHLAVTYPTRRTWMDAAARVLGGGF